MKEFIGKGVIGWEDWETFFLKPVSLYATDYEGITIRR